MSYPVCFVARTRRALRWGIVSVAAAGWALPGASWALQFDSDWLGGIDISVITELSVGGQWRMQDRSEDLVGKATIDPDVCRSACQPHLSTNQAQGMMLQTPRIQLGLEAEGDAVNQAGLDARGAGSINADNGNINFDKYDLTQGVVQFKQDVTLEFADFSFVRKPQIFLRYAAFHDFVNYNRKQFYNSFYTPQDRQRDDDRLTDGNPAAAPGGTFGEPQPGSQVFRDPLDQDKYNEFAGQDFDLLDAFVQAELPVPFTDLYGQLTIGEQIINWGESTILVVNSLNSINPPNVNALFRPAFLSLAAVFEPIGAVKWSMPLTLNTSFEAFYQYDWERVEIPPSGAYLSTIDVTLDSDKNNVNPGFGQVTDDPDGNLNVQQQLLSGIADTNGQVPVFEKAGSRDNQYGLAFTWFIPEFNNGT